MKGLQLSLFQLHRIKNIFRALPSSRPSQKKNRPGKKSDARLKELWVRIRSAYFPDRPDIDQYTLLWSTRRQIRTLASCNIERKRVIVAMELNHKKYYEWLEPLLYHEMCHAILGREVISKHGRSRWHGKEFKALEKKHPRIAELDGWIKNGGWATAVRSHRAREAHKKRREFSQENARAA